MHGSESHATQRKRAIAKRGRPKNSRTSPEIVVEDRPPGCPRCQSTARLVLRIVRRDRLTGDGRELVRRRVLCQDCGGRYTLLTWERRLPYPPEAASLGQNSVLS